jgi:hypothetical protein
MPMRFDNFHTSFAAMGDCKRTITSSREEPELGAEGVEAGATVEAEELAMCHNVEAIGQRARSEVSFAIQ